jgi:hypothetical protein
MVIEKQLIEINLELKAISERIEKSLTAFHKFEYVQSFRLNKTIGLFLFIFWDHLITPNST